MMLSVIFCEMLVIISFWKKNERGKWYEKGEYILVEMGHAFNKVALILARFLLIMPPEWDALFS